MKKEVDQVLDSIKKGEVEGFNVSHQEGTQTERPEQDSISEKSTPELPQKPAGRPPKRCREPDDDVQETMGVGSPEDEITVIHSSTSSPHDAMDQDPVIDLTQQ